jgi:hypothetical protein
MKFPPGNLQVFAKNHPSQCVSIDPLLGDNACIRQWDGGNPLGKIIAYYSRLRDARRALKRLGYVQEGAAWRKVPKSEQPSPILASEEIPSQ